MLIIPAIDIKNGKCVRLTQGDFNREKIYADDPVTVATQWEAQGAKMLHVVDLDGAKNGELANIKIIKKIAKSLSIPVQVGGGIRNKESVRKLLSFGVSRVILGTVALEDKDELLDILTDYALQTVVGLDTKNGQLMKKGWLETSNKNINETAQELEKCGVKRFIYTDVVKDGTLTEPNYLDLTRLTKNISVPVTVAGGITNGKDLVKLRKLGIDEVIIGKALYERRITLQSAMEIALSSIHS